jgi:hypothetical protein
MTGGDRRGHPRDDRGPCTAGVRRQPLGVANVSVPATHGKPILSANATTDANPARGAGLGSSSTAETRENS